MTTPDWQPHDTALIEAWGNTIADSATGVGYNFLENRTTRLRDRMDAFLAAPSEEQFADVWSADTLNDAVFGGPDYILANWSGSIEDLASFFQSIDDAAEYDSGWESRFPGPATSLWELFGRLHVDTHPVLSSEAKYALAQFGYPKRNEYDRVATQYNDFRERYRELVGHPTKGTPHEVPLNSELDQFFNVVTSVGKDELRDSRSAAETPLYRPLIGWKTRQDRDGRVLFSDLRPLLDAYATARQNGTFQEERTDDWGGSHWETWKWAYQEHIEETVKPRFDLANLTADDIEPLMDALDERVEISSHVPTYMLGGRSGGIAWGDFKSISIENPEEAAEVLSLFFDDSEFIGDRLRRFRDFYSDIDTSGGPLLSLASVLLMFVYPDDYIMYRYTEHSHFFEEYSDYEITTGFDTDQYWVFNQACNAIKERLDDRLDNASMLDVHTLIWVWHREGNPT